jgi:hypothetical protein
VDVGVLVGGDSEPLQQSRVAGRRLERGFDDSARAVEVAQTFETSRFADRIGLQSRHKRTLSARRSRVTCVESGAVADAIRVMLSSRVDDPASALPDRTPLRAVRARLEDSIGGIVLVEDGDPLFDVFVNEGAAALAGDADVARHCREQVARADVVLVLYNGRAGWASQKGLAGICEIELQTALDFAPQKVRMIRLPVEPAPAASPDGRFQAWVDEQNLWSSQEVQTVDEIVEQSHAALRDLLVTATHRQAQAGSVRATRGRGEALRWSRMGLRNRAEAMREATANALLEGKRAKAIRARGAVGGGRLVAFSTASQPILTRIDAVPAAMSVAAARELVGQPFLRDHELVDLLEDRVGPLHLIAVHGGVTEAQAIRQLGSPDATIVPTDFGVYVADEIQKVQMIFLARCIDRASIYARVQTLLDWLRQTAEGDRLASRADGRKEVVTLLARLAEAP